VIGCQREKNEEFVLLLSGCQREGNKDFVLLLINKVDKLLLPLLMPDFRKS